MPATNRGAAGYAHVDQDLADWLTARGYPCAASRVANWRAAGLLPVPTRVADQVEGRRGRRPLLWTDAELADVHSIALRLVVESGRGASNSAIALRLASEGLPIPPTAVLVAARKYLRELARSLYNEFGMDSSADQVQVAPELVEAVVDEYVATRPEPLQLIERSLRGVDLDPDGANAESVVTLVAAAALGGAPDPEDEEPLILALRVFGMGGLVEPIGAPEGPRVLAGGSREVAEALELFSLPVIEELLAAVRPQDVRTALEATSDLGRAFAAVPADAAHYLAAEAFANALLSDAPLYVVLRLVCWQALHARAADGSISTMIGAMQAQAWFPPDDQRIVPGRVDGRENLGRR